MNKPIDILIVDDHTLFRKGLRLLLNEMDNYRVVGEASNGIEMLRTLELIQVDIILLDIAMPEMDGIEAAKKALNLYPNIKIITLSMFDDADYYFKMVETGVHGFLLKDSDIIEVKNALDTVMNGRNYFSQELMQNVIYKMKDSSENENLLHQFDLTTREIEIIRLVCKGFSNHEIADQMCVSKRTIEKHRANVMEKCHCKNTADLVIFAVKHKIVNINN